LTVPFLPLTGTPFKLDNMKKKNELQALEQRLAGLLQQYLLANHPDLAIALEEDHRLANYLTGKAGSVRELASGLLAEKRPGYVIEALCLEELTRDLRPSRFEYLRNLLEEEFEGHYRQLQLAGILTYEIINLTGACEPVFEVFGFGGENEDSKELRYALTGMIAEYLER
jgi:hypothetical protein